MRGRNLDYLFVLKALEEIPFSVGKKLLIDFLRGKETNESIKRNKLHLKENFGSMAYGEDELTNLIDNLLLNDLIRMASVKSNKFWKVMELTAKGRKEIDDPELYKKKLSFNFKETETVITAGDRKLFDSLGEVLARFNDPQKKAITSNKKHILCLAGAGSGKTTVLTQRVEFLVKYRSVDPRRILAITFTRKARQEMMKRLDHLDSVRIETFNSFCEKILKQHNDLLYDQQVEVISYRDKINIINRALSKLNLTIEQAISIYFSYAQRRGKTDEQLANIFMNDCFFIRDYFKFKNKPLDQASFEDPEHQKSAKMVFGVCSYIEAYLKKHGLRDFADQLIDTIFLFEKNKGLMPCFDHILVDEYQDVNSTQIKLIDLLAPDNLFCVGDPRQSIFGWRGSDIKYILNFEENYPSSEIITLTKNYRSTKHLVGLINNSIKNMGLADLDSSLEGEKDINLLKFDSEDAEFEFVIQKIIASELHRNEIFVLARTNRQLHELSQLMKLRGIKHVVRSDELRRSVIAGEDDVTLATIHAIKGLEAELVFVLGCNGLNFPCKGSEHPVVDLVKLDEYDKEEEERRLFYVAM
ncbi:MAG: UvrD-helicase domain-containing protein, partial [Candidatus Woesearchaeota archaeon]